MSVSSRYRSCHFDIFLCLTFYLLVYTILKDEYYKNVTVILEHLVLTAKNRYDLLTFVSEATNGDTIKHKQIPEYKLYKRRWMILCLFILFAISSLVQWIQYSIIADVIVRYYGISYAAADWSSMIFLLLYIPFSFPGSYVLDKWGLRVAILLGMFGTCIGTWIKVGSVHPDRYWVLLVGQAFIAIFEVFILPIPPKLAAVWFGANEVSSACSVANLGIQLGIAVGFLIPPLLIDNQGNTEAIQDGLYIMALAMAIVNSILMLILLGLFQAEPPTPPSSAQSQIQENKVESVSFMQSLKNIGCNRSYVLLLIAYGMNCGLYYAISVLLNQLILKYHPDAAKDAGIIGLITVLFGMAGSVVCGVTLDKFGRYKETTLSIYTLSLLAMIAFTFTITEHIAIIYVVSAVLGFSMIGITTLALELGVELTYPEPEGTSGGLLVTSAQIFGVIFIYLYSFLLNNLGDVWANLVMCIILFIGNILATCIKFNLRRHIAQGNKAGLGYQ